MIYELKGTIVHLFKSLAHFFRALFCKDYYIESHGLGMCGRYKYGTCFCEYLWCPKRCDKCGIKQDYEKIGDEPKEDCDKDECLWWSSKSNKCIRTLGCVKDEQMR